MFKTGDRVILLKGYKDCETCAVGKNFRDTAYIGAKGKIIEMRQVKDYLTVLFDDKNIKGHDIGNRVIPEQYICSKHLRFYSLLDRIEEKCLKQAI